MEEETDVESRDQLDEKTVVEEKHELGFLVIG